MRDDFVAAGYILTRAVPRNDEYMSTDLLPPRLVSLSGCLGTNALDIWWNDEEVSRAAEFGVAPSRFGELVEWYTSRFEVDLWFPDVASSLDVIRSFVRQFVDDPKGLVALGFGLDPMHATELLAGVQRSPGEGAYGIEQALRRGESLARGGTVLGYEPASYEFGLEHSWLCNSLEPTVAERLGVRPDPETGLIGNFVDACQAVELIRSPEVGAEPGQWLPWLVVRYDL